MGLDLLLVQLGFELHQELVDHAQDDLVVQRLERDHRIQAVAELGREQALDVGHLVARLTLGGEPDHRLLHGFGAGVGGHDDDHVAEIRLPAVVVGQRAVVHDLQQDVVDVRMRLLDLVEQQHAMRLLGDLLGQQATLVEADVARGRADQATDRMAFHVLGHVEAHQFDAQRVGELAGDLGLADAGGAGEQEGADRLLRVAEPGARHLDRLGERLDRGVLAEHHVLQVAVERLQRCLVVIRDRARRDAGDLGDDVLDLVLADGLLLLRLGQDALRRPGFVDHVDRLVGQVAVVDEFRRQLCGTGQRRIAVLDAVMLLEAALEPLEDLDRLGHRGLDHVDLLEAP